MRTVILVAALLVNTSAHAQTGKPITGWGSWGNCVYLLYDNAVRSLQQDTRVCDRQVGDDRSHGTPVFNACMTRQGWDVNCDWPKDRKLPGDDERVFETPNGPCGAIVC